MGLDESEHRREALSPPRSPVKHIQPKLPIQPRSPPVEHNSRQIISLTATHPASPDSTPFNHNPVHWGQYRSYGGREKPPFAPGAGDRLTIVRIPTTLQEQPQQPKHELPAPSPGHFAPNALPPTPTDSTHSAPAWNPYRHPLPPNVPAKEQQLGQQATMTPLQEAPIIRRRRAQSSRNSIESPTVPISPGPVPKRHSISKRASMSLEGKGPLSATSSNRSFPCPLTIYGCTSTFGSKNEWKRHVNTQHMRLGFWRCDMCPNGDRKPNDFNRKDLFIQHVRRMHPAAANRTEPSTMPPKAGKDNENMQALREAADRCYKALRHPPEQSRCLFCDQQFLGNGSWDDRMEHVGRHLELTRREGQLPPEPHEWRQDADVNQWMVRERIIHPNGPSFVLDEANIVQKPLMHATSGTFPKPIAQTGTAPQTNGQHAQPQSIITTDNWGRVSSPKQRYDPVHDARDRAHVDNVTAAAVHMNGNARTEDLYVNGKKDEPESEQKLSGAVAVVEQRSKVAQRPQDDGDPYMALFSAIKGGDEEVDDDDDDKEKEEEDDEEPDIDPATVPGAIPIDEATGGAVPMDDLNDFGSDSAKKDEHAKSYYDAIKNRAWGAVQSLGRLFAGRPDADPELLEAMHDGARRSASPVAKRTRSARAKGGIPIVDDDSEHEGPLRKRTRQSVISSRS